MNTTNPITRFQQALEAAEAKGVILANAFNLTTVTREGKPSSRVMLLKEVDEQGFVFYTNLKSRKAEELQANPQVALCFWWAQLEEQIRIEGKAELVSDEEADTYFASRPRGSQLGAWASEQSHDLPSREILLQAVATFQKKYPGPVPRPPFWSGFRVVPETIEFWFGKIDRLHDRFLYQREGMTWTEKRLYP